MKFVFFGTPEFAAVILQKLIEGGFIPTAVVCNPDRPIGRKKIIAPPPAKTVVRNGKLESRIEILQPEDPLSLIPRLSSLQPDFFIVAAYAKILPQKVLDIPRLGVIGVHPSLLPKYRGASPIQSAILNGDEETGVTLYLLDDKMDHGPIIAVQKIKTESKNYAELMRELAEIGGDLLVETLPKIIECETPTPREGRSPDYCVGIKPRPQNESEATYAKKFSTEDAFVDEKALEEAMNGGNPEAARRIERKIRALTPEPGVWTHMRALANPRISDDGSKKVKLLEAKIQDDALIFKTIQIEGEKPKKL